MLLSGASHKTDSLTRQDVQQLDSAVLNRVADVFNLPRRRLADALNNVIHTEL